MRGFEEVRKGSHPGYLGPGFLWSVVAHSVSWSRPCTSFRRCTRGLHLVHLGPGLPAARGRALSEVDGLEQAVRGFARVHQGLHDLLVQRPPEVPVRVR